MVLCEMDESDGGPREESSQGGVETRGSLQTCNWWTLRLWSMACYTRLCQQAGSVTAMVVVCCKATPLEKMEENPRITPMSRSLVDMVIREDIATLGTTVQQLLQAGVAPTTQKAYLAGKQKHLEFCQEIPTACLPVTEQK